MITYKQEVVPSTERTVVDKVICDLCKAEAPNPSSYKPWATGSSYAVEEVEVSYESGSHYPEGRFTETIKLDICPTCFVKRLVPWLESQGAVVTKKNSEL